MTAVKQFDASLFEDKYLRLRLSTRYAVDNNLYDTISYEEFCKAFFDICPNLVNVKPPANELHPNILTVSVRAREMAAWCSEFCSGYWMNGNFPSGVATRVQGNLLNLFWSFQYVEDAIMFRLKFC